MSDLQRNVPITAAMRAQAQTSPNSWFPVVAPGTDENGALVLDAALGRYRIDDQGRITDEFVPNARYRPLQVPPLTPEMQETAKSRPGGWIEVLDPMYPEPVPPAGAIGRYPVDQAGVVSGDFQVNPAYRPSPLTLGWPAPRTEVEAAMQMAHTGLLDKDEVVVAVLASALVLPADPARGLREHLVLRKEGDRSTVDAFLTEDAVPGDWPPHWQQFTGLEIAVLINGLAEPADLLLYGQPDLQVRIRGDVLATRLQEVLAVSQ
ncbi:hypothetical protein JOF56_006564 [Kibdelosporangium banguiense]|uniref:SseB protein N-terminal domain-containing protein n=1 Tax=Kibdelosporangium banguiense TaxID=1365924 RepID=A0ABS4TP44_9PSEU|nr:type VII secretion system-associated protein [Kibdelosporangium banguiense]MBP2326179.1 hypothetical protein [Kibdelosporangium banguiense]